MGLLEADADALAHADTIGRMARWRPAGGPRTAFSLTERAFGMPAAGGASLRDGRDPTPMWSLPLGRR
jgi:hypothetical protein